MIVRRSLLYALPGTAAAAAVRAQGSTARETSPAAIGFEALDVRNYGAKGDGHSDDTAALQAALDAAVGKTLRLEPVRYRISGTLWLAGHRRIIEGRGAVLEFQGQGPAIGFRLVGNRIYPGDVIIGQLQINVNGGPDAVGMAVRASHSSFDDVTVTLRDGAAGAIGFDLVGDEATGSGPYYNTFKNCAVDGEGERQTGVRFTSTAPQWRAPNANTWVGGRIGRCETGIRIAGCGNSFFNPTVADCATAIEFGRAHENHVFGCYLEQCATGLAFGSGSLGNAAIGIYAGSVQNFIADTGVGNWTFSDVAAARLPAGVRFGRPSSDPEVLDHYQEGEWTPTVGGGKQPGKYRVETNSSKYVRIGCQVSLSARMSIREVEQGEGVARFGGLPFPKAAETTMVGNAATVRIRWPTEVKWVAALPWTSSSDGTFWLAGVRSNSTPYALNIVDMPDGCEVDFSATYFTLA